MKRRKNCQKSYFNYQTGFEAPHALGEIYTHHPLLLVATALLVFVCLLLLSATALLTFVCLSVCLFVCLSVCLFVCYLLNMMYRSSAINSVGAYEYSIRYEPDPLILKPDDPLIH